MQFWMICIENLCNMLINFIIQTTYAINYANKCPVKLIRCPTKMKIWKDACPVNEEKLFPALQVSATQWTVKKFEFEGFATNCLLG